MRGFTRRTVFGLAAGAAAAAALDACSSSSSTATATSTAVTQAEIDRAMKTPTTLTFWTWVPEISQEVAVFEQKYPAVKVNVVNAGQSLPQYTKLRTALTAGKGTPDLAQIEYEYLPTFTITDSLVDLRPYGAAANASKFVPWVWGQVTGANGEIYAYPQDTGPMGLLYREDIFAKHSIAVPTTWDEFATAAKTLHAADPSAYLTNLSDNDAGAWHGLLWQAGAKPYSVSGTTIGLDVNDAAAQKVASYWGGLVSDGLVSTDPDFTDTWYTGLDTGKYATWVTAAWAPVFMTGSVKATAGKWRAAPVPQWASGQQVSGNWGGSTTAVVKGTAHPIAAAVFAEFLNTDPATTSMFNTAQNLFPSTTALLGSSSFIGDKNAFFGGQQVNQVFAGISATINTGFQWPPFLDEAVSDWTSTIGKALGDKGDVATAADQWESQLTSYATSQGFHVAAG